MLRLAAVVLLAGVAFSQDISQMSQQERYCDCFGRKFRDLLADSYQHIKNCLIEMEVTSEQWEQCQANPLVELPVKLYDFTENYDKYEDIVEQQCIYANDLIPAEIKEQLKTQVHSTVLKDLKPCVDSEVMEGVVVV